MIDHHLQRSVLKALSRSHGLRFTDLKPGDVDNNAFTYHLKQLIREKLIDKQDDLYHLTPQGLTYINLLSSQDDRPRLQPKIISIIAVHHEGRYLLAKRKEHPSLGTYMLPSGKQHFDESPEQHVKREATEQFGHELAFERRGLADIRISYEGELVTHLVAHVYTAAMSIDTPAPTDKFSYEWHEVTQLSDAQLTPGTREIVQAIERDDQLFYLSLDVDAL